MKRLLAALLSLVLVLVGVGGAVATTSSATTFGAANPGRIGPVDVERVYKNLPRNWDRVTQQSVVSFKLPPRKVNAGRYDRMLRTWFRTAPNYRIWYVYWHEAENDMTTPARQRAYRNAWKHIVKIERATGRNRLFSTIVLMNYTLQPASKRTITDYYPGDKWIDVVAFDGFNWDYYREYRTPGEIYGAGYRWARQHNKPYASAEWGSAVIAGDTQGRARWIRAAGRWFSNRNARFATYWNNQKFAVTDRPSLRAVRSLM
jgi:hypothetical protein